MATVHNFSTPRNLYEKLLRDAEKMDQNLNGDNFFNFMATANHLITWIKKSPLSSSEEVKRLMRKLTKSEEYKLCCDLLDFKKSYSIEVDESDSQAYLKTEDGFHSPFELRNKILNEFSTYFQIK
jgi:hypothetical protein